MVIYPERGLFIDNVSYLDPEDVTFTIFKGMEMEIRMMFEKGVFEDESVVAEWEDIDFKLCSEGPDCFSDEKVRERVAAIYNLLNFFRMPYNARRYSNDNDRS
ncbi:hypothetical protein A73_242 [Escherichia phage A73]|uniref:Uncharacterized protein n=2 Tax=Vequintavirinae TaxID=1911928 RepID=A0AAF0AQK6_9CAUD|nr:hypothetical protein A54_131 [Escherichia phage A5-4]WBF77712.1 hypothetical protein A73_242 [Escherichia phage A73]WBF77964.1 hypothetical protein W70_227 [Escherichia phage W70]